MQRSGRISIEAIEDLLPQTQCRQCGHDGCTPYAEALLTGAAINLCVPGGDPVARHLADMLGSTFLPVANAPLHAPWRGTVARIIEEDCIGCTKCIAACPVDAIIGAQKLMHTVISDECTGCELCIAPCPTDCIVMEAVKVEPGRERANRARHRHDVREQRLARAQRSAVGSVIPPVPPVTVVTPMTVDLPSHGITDLKRLETAALSARKRWKEAAAALRVAEKARRPDLDSLRQRVAQLDQKANDAEHAWKQASAREPGETP